MPTDTPTKDQKTAGTSGSDGGTTRADHALPENSKANLDAKLDHAVDETFPGSDPVSIKITK